MGALADLVGTVPTLAGRVHDAARLSTLMATNQLPQVCPAAFILPLGLRGGAADAATGLFRHAIDRLHGVVLVVRSAGDATGAKAGVQMEPLIEDTIAAVVGCSDDKDFGVFVLSRGELVSLAAGTLTYQLDFAIEDQLRIAR